MRPRPGRLLGVALTAALSLGFAACGARTEIFENQPRPDAGAHPDVAPRDTAPPDVGHDSAPPDTGPPDTGPPDVAPPDTHTGCTSDAQCDDGVACTQDSCDLATGVCMNTPVDTSCAPGSACFPTTGCMPANFAQNLTTFYSVVLPTGTISVVSPTAQKFYDIALRADGTLFGITEGALFTIDPNTAASTLVASLDRALDGLDFSPDGTLYGAAPATTDVYTIDPVAGTLTTFANLPDGYSCSGDVAVFGTTLLVSATSLAPGTPDVLIAVELDVTPPVVTMIGSTGYSCIWGLAVYEGVVYGFTCLGEVLTIDPTTAAAALVTKNSGDTFYGAAAR